MHPLKLFHFWLIGDELGEWIKQARLLLELTLEQVVEDAKLQFASIRL